MEHGWVLRVWHDLFLIYRIPIERENAKEKKQHARPGRKKNLNDAATQTGDQPHTTPTSTTNGTPA